MALLEKPRVFKWSIAPTCTFWIFLLNPSDLDLLRLSLLFRLKVLLCVYRSIDVVLNMEPAVSKMLKGKSGHFIQDSFIKSEALNRLRVSGSINFCITYLASLDNVSGYFIWALWILEYNSVSLCPLKGKAPAKRANRRTPNAHMSTYLPSYSCLRTSSGAIYDGVPQKILSFCWLVQKAAKPKSITLIIFVLSSIRILSSLTSLWAIPLECK